MIHLMVLLEGECISMVILNLVGFLIKNLNYMDMEKILIINLLAYLNKGLLRSKVMKSSSIILRQTLLHKK